MDGSLTDSGAGSRRYLSHAWNGSALELRVNDGVISLTPYGKDSVEVHFAPHGISDETPSFARCIQAASTPAKLKEAGDRLVLELGALELVVNKDPLCLSYAFRGRPLLREADGLYLGKEDKRGARFFISGEERFFGGGSRAFGRMDRRGKALELYNAACYDYEKVADRMYYGMPAVVSSKKYMLVFDNAARGVVDVDRDGEGILHFEAHGGRLSYLLMAGETWPDLAGAVARVTGHQPMLPRWALGMISSRMGYLSQAEVEDVADQFLQEDIPLDAVVLDLYWFGPDLRGYMGNLDWDRAHWPRPVAMMQKLREQGVKTILITEPFILTTSSNWPYASTHHVLASDHRHRPRTIETFFGEAGLVDVFKPEAREWFWNFYRKHTESGVAGWWGDLGEPESHPDDIHHHLGTGRELHNAYGHEWARLVYEGFQKDFPDQRPFNLMRSGFVGSQRYGMLPWSGDVKRSWGGLKPQPEIALQMGLQGVGYMHSDLGGFAGDYKDSELYIRWMQYGVFQPIYRPHGHGQVPPEPVFWDGETKRIVREWVKLRYRLMPYNYTLVYENAVEGLPLMRPLMYLDDRPEMQDCTDVYLWGDAFLVAPVLRKGARRVKVPLPADTVWFDYWSGRRYEGGRTVAPRAELETIPVFVKAGSFVPMIDPVQHAGDYDPSRLEVHYYHDDSAACSRGRLYDDDGETPDAYAKGLFELLQFEARFDSGRVLELGVEGLGQSYRGRPETRMLTFVIHGLSSPPAGVEQDGVPAAGVSWDAEDRLLCFPLAWQGRPCCAVIRLQ